VLMVDQSTTACATCMRRSPTVSLNSTSTSTTTPEIAVLASFEEFDSDQLASVLEILQPVHWFWYLLLLILLGFGTYKITKRFGL
jgi:hypothetical protein